MYFFVELSMPWATDEKSTIAIITNEKQWRCKNCSPNLTNESRRHTINACANCATYTETSAAADDIARRSLAVEPHEDLQRANLSSSTMPSTV